MFTSSPAPSPRRASWKLRFSRSVGDARLQTIPAGNVPRGTVTIGYADSCVSRERHCVRAINQMSRILSVANQKGGVGKTTTTINLATALALGEQRILVVDMDPQGNLTSGVGLKGQSAAPGTIYQALTSPDPIDDPATLRPRNPRQGSVADSRRSQPHRRGSRARRAPPSRAAAARSAHAAARSIRLHPHRHAAVARTPDAQRARRRRRRADSAQLRILRARRARRSRRHAAARARVAQSRRSTSPAC